MPATRTYCPRCRQPITADINQLFDVSADPAVKQRFLSGQFNLANCPHCGYQGNLATPLVYHDADKELLLTYFPPELGLPVNEQERLIGPLITQVTNRLPNEKRKAYLLRPSNVLTLQGMMERILEADGITKEMIDAQQQRINLVQRMLAASEEARVEMAKAEEALVDESVFNLLNRLIEGAIGARDEGTARQLAGVQKVLLENTRAGQALAEQASEADAAVKSLQEASKQGLTREALLDLLVNAPTETRLMTLVSMARAGLDYAFFQILSERIDQASVEDRARLTALRDKLLDLTHEYDEEMKLQLERNRELLEKVLEQPDVEGTTREILPAVTQMFVDVLNQEMEQARKAGNLERLGKLQQVVNVLQQASAPPPEYHVLEELLEATTDADRRKVLDAHRDLVSQEFMDLLANLMAQAESQDPEAAKQLEEAYNFALRYSMEAKMKN